VIVQTQIEGTRLAGNLLDDPTERDLFVYQVAPEWLPQTPDGDVP